MRRSSRVLGRRIATLALATVFVCAAASSLRAQHTLTAGTAAGVPGSDVQVAIQLDNPELVRGYSIGLVHDGLVLTLNAIEQGADVAATNSGAGADYFFTDVAPENGPGGIVACVVSLSAPLEDIPIAPDNEIALFDYTIAAGAAGGTSATLEFSSDLGDPPVLTIVSVLGVSVFPALVGGSVSVLDFELDGFVCAQPDPCECTFEASWTNSTSFDAIRVYLDGVLTATLAGSATAYSLFLDTGESVSLEVVPVVGALEGSSGACSLTCAPLAPPAPPAMLACTVDLSDCEAAISWQNAALYAAIEVSLDGVLQATLAGSATSTSLILVDAAPHELCITGIDSCDLASTPACCTIACPQPFERGDGNGDGSLDISDAIFVLEYLFAQGSAGCVDAMDLDDNGAVGLADAIYELAYLFQDGADPAAPLGACGNDTTADSLGCEAFAACP